MKNKLLIVTATSFIGLVSQSWASSINTTFGVSATVLNTCSTVTATAISFGDYDPLSGSNLDSTGNINVTCTSGTPFTIKLNGGLHGSIAQRKMKQDGGNGELMYGLYKDSNHTTVWGDDAAGEAVTGTGTGSSLQKTVYGRVSGGQSSSNAGSYSDTIVVTVDY